MMVLQHNLVRKFPTWAFSTVSYIGMLLIEGPSGKRGHVPFEILILLKTERLVLAI